MKESSLVKRYAKALVLAMDSEEEFRRVQRDLASFQNLLAADERLKLGLETSMVSQGEKTRALEIAAERMGMQDKTLRFLLTVVAESRMAYLEAITAGLADAWYAERGIEKISVASAIALSAAQQQRLRANLEKTLNKRVEIEFYLEPQLIAGLRLGRGSVHYDFSLAGSLKKLRETLVGER